MWMIVFCDLGGKFYNWHMVENIRRAYKILVKYRRAYWSYIIPQS